MSIFLVHLPTNSSLHKMHVGCPGEFSDLLSKSSAECLISLNETRQLLRLNVACFVLQINRGGRKWTIMTTFGFLFFFLLRHDNSEMVSNTKSCFHKCIGSLTPLGNHIRKRCLHRSPLSQSVCVRIYLYIVGSNVTDTVCLKT